MKKKKLATILTSVSLIGHVLYGHHLNLLIKYSVYVDTTTTPSMGPAYAGPREIQM